MSANALSKMTATATNHAVEILPAQVASISGKGEISTQRIAKTKKIETAHLLKRDTVLILKQFQS
jgi:hypothetical protein